VLLQEVLEEGAEAEYGLGMGGDLQAIRRGGFLFFSIQDIGKDNEIGWMPDKSAAIKIFSRWFDILVHFYCSTKFLLYKTHEQE
jgi:hypothetical protein